MKKVIINEEQKEFLKEFFASNKEIISDNNMLEPDDISSFIDLYSDCLENSRFKEDDILKLFLLDLKKSLYYETMVKEGKVKLSPKEMMRRKSIPASSISYKCKNRVINKWIIESKVFKTISPSEKVEFNRGLEPIIKQNAKELQLCWEDVRNKRVR